MVPMYMPLLLCHHGVKALLDMAANIVSAPFRALAYIFKSKNNTQECTLPTDKSITKPLSQDDMVKILSIKGEIKTKYNNTPENKLQLKFIENIEKIQKLLNILNNIKDDNIDDKNTYTIIDSNNKIYSLYMLSDNSDNSDNPNNKQQSTTITTINDNNKTDHRIHIKPITGIDINNLQQFLQTKAKQHHNETRIMKYLYEIDNILKSVAPSAVITLKDTVLIGEIFIDLYQNLINVRSDLISFNQKEFDEMLNKMYKRIYDIRGTSLVMESHVQGNLNSFNRHERELKIINTDLDDLDKKLKIAKDSNDTTTVNKISKQKDTLRKIRLDMEYPPIPKTALKHGRNTIKSQGILSSNPQQAKGGNGGNGGNGSNGSNSSNVGKSKKNSNRHKQRKQSRKHL